MVDLPYKALGLNESRVKEILQSVHIFMSRAEHRLNQLIKIDSATLSTIILADIIEEALESAVQDGPLASIKKAIILSCFPEWMCLPVDTARLPVEANLTEEFSEESFAQNIRPIFTLAVHPEQLDDLG